MASKHGADLLKLRDRIGILKEKIATAELSIVPIETAFQRADDMIADLAEQGVISGEEFAIKDYGRPRIEGADDVLRFLVWADADRLKEHLRGVIAEYYEDYLGSFDSQTAQAQIKADKEALFQLEVEEEKLILLAESEGFSLTRRADADPLAVLSA